ncbi:MAG: ATP-dependent DNA helicase [Phycisphaerales bacterium]
MRALSESISEMLAPGGAVAACFGEGFEARPQQVEMAETVAAALEKRSHLLVEAGTGVGKSFAYLLPAVRRIVQTEGAERVVVATNTIALQEQLLKKDVPLLEKVFRTVGADGAEKPAFTAELVKGRGNYVSIRRLRLASERQDKLFHDADARATLHAIEDWAYETTDGTLATLPQLDRPGVWDKVQSDSGNCMGRKCPNYEQCFYQTARRRMERANLLICNHALFFSDLALRARGAGFLPTYHHVILDEAHGVEDAASDHFGVSLAESRVQFLLSGLYSTQRSARSKSGARGLLASARTVTDETARDAAVRCVQDADEASRQFFDGIVSASNTAGGRGGTVRTPPLRPTEDESFPNPVTPAFRALGLALKRMKDNVTEEAEKYEINAFVERCAAVADSAEILVGQQLDGFAYWTEVTAPDGQRFRGVRATIACAPVDVAPILRAHLLGGGGEGTSEDQSRVSVILTSATLTTGKGSFKHAAARLGMEDAQTLALGSPFDHAAQSELFADATIPDPRHPAYAEAVAERVCEHLEATDGGAFVLCTSFQTMHAILRAAAPTLERNAWPTWVHGRDGSRERILEEFRKDERSVLFGTSSFWQGVDVRGRGLRNVIITRLPFDPPDRPLTQARLERIEALGGNPFMEDSLPRAVIRFKQGFGRLVRSATDHGRVVVLDPRILTARYGRLFLDALPEGVKVVERR